MKFSNLQESVRKHLISFNFLLNHKEQAMTCQSCWYRSVLAGIALIAGLGFFTTPVFAQGTAPGTSITNTATLNYQVGGVGQTAIPASSTAFLVDRLVRMTVTEANALPTPVVPGALAQVTQFLVTNTGNLAQAYTLATAELPNGATVTLGSLLTDNLALTAASCIARVENNLAGGYTPSGPNQDTAAAITSLAPGASATVYVVCDVPFGSPNNAVAIVSLTATTAETAGCTITGAGCTATAESPRGAADVPGNVEIVFGDAAGSEAGDIVRDGKHSARDAYQVAAANITVTKSVTLLCDPVNFNVNPRNIPGAYVTYSVVISNAPAAASATLQTITDTLNANLNFDVNLALATGAACPGVAESANGSGFKLICTGGSRACVATPVYYTSLADGDSVGIVGQAITANLGTALIVEAGYGAGELKGGESVTIRFNAIIK